LETQGYDLSFIVTPSDTSSFVNNRLLNSEESSTFYRNQKHQSPIFKPDFKSGNFFTRDDFARRPGLLTTISDLSKGMRKPVWFSSDVYFDALSNLKSDYLNFFTQTSSSPAGDGRVSQTFLQNPYGFFNVFHLFSTAKVFDDKTKGFNFAENTFLNQR
jgi:hypothetical protein